MRAWPAPAQGLLASGVSPGSTLNAPITLTQTSTATSGTVNDLLVTSSYADGGTNSTTVVKSLSLTQTVNFTGASRTGKVVLANFAPTLTSIPSGTNAGISFSSAFTSSTFPAMRFHNVADEDTNYEVATVGWHLNTNAFAFRTDKGGTGTLRVIDFYYSATTSAAMRVPTSITGAVDLALSCANGASVTAARVRIGSGSSTTATSGTHTTLTLADSFSPTATSTMAAYGVFINPTINYSNGTPGAGQVYCAYIKPVNTALPTGLNAGLAFASTASGLTGAALFHNQSDEVTNFEYVSMGYTSNNFLISSTKGGTGTARSIGFSFSGNIKYFLQSTRLALASGIPIAWDNGDAFSTIPLTLQNTAQAGAQGWTWTVNGTLTSSPTDFNIETYSTALAGAFTATRLNVFNVQNVTGAATVTDMPLFRFDANAGTHKSVNSGTTKTSPGTVTQWIVINVNGTLGYIPSYSSKTT